MSRCNVIVTGASAGGVGSLIQLVGGLPADLNAAVAAVLHVPEESPSALPVILARSGPLPAAHAIDNEPLEHGRIYVAPPDRHLLVKRRSVRVVVGPNENRHRPAAAGRWRSMGCTIARTPLRQSSTGTVRGVIVLMEESGPRRRRPVGRLVRRLLTARNALRN